jgi:hypothetical protein
MGFSDPLRGVGIDSYGLYYRTFRPLESAGIDTTTDAAHNVFIDFFAGAGIVALICYLSLSILVLVVSLKYIKNLDKFDPIFFTFFIGWVGYQLQSLISINQIGLAVWGWALTGLIIGWKPSLEFSNETKKQPKTSIKNEGNPTLSPKNFLVLTTGLVIGLAISIPPLVSSSKEKSGMAASQLEKILSAERNWPRDASRSNQIAVILVSNKLEKDAIRIAKSTVSQFPKNYDAWKILSEIPSSAEADKLLAKSQMKMLDPFNTNLK